MVSSKLSTVFPFSRVAVGDSPSLRKFKELKSPFLNSKVLNRTDTGSAYLGYSAVHISAVIKSTAAPLLTYIGQGGCHHGHRLTLEGRKSRGISSNEVAQTPLHRISSLTPCLHQSNHSISGFSSLRASAAAAWTRLICCRIRLLRCFSPPSTISKPSQCGEPETAASK